MSDLRHGITNAATAWTAVGPPVPARVCALVVDEKGAIVAANGAIRGTVTAGRHLLSVVPQHVADRWHSALTAASRGRATAGLLFDDRGTIAEVHPWRGGAVVYPVGPVTTVDDAPGADGLRSIVDGLQQGVIEELDRFRDVVAVLDEAIYVYAPIFDGSGEIVDLRVVEQNPAAVAQPRSTVTQINMLASEGFRDPELAIAAAREAWRNGRAERYLLSIPDDDGTTVHYEISTLRAGNLLVQVSADRTSEMAVVEARERYRRTLESLEQAVVAFTPVWQDGRIVDASIDYVNRTALALVPALPQFPTLRAVKTVGAHLVAFVAEVATTGVPRQVVVDNTDRTTYPLLMAETMELAFYPDGDRVIAIATDRTLLQNAERDGRATRALLEQGIASLVEPFLVFEPIFGADGTIVDAHLAYANEAATTSWTVEIPLGDRLSAHWSRLDIFVTAANDAWSGRTARYRLDTFSEPMPEMLPTVDDVTIVRAAERLVMTSNNRTAEMQALRELAASEVLFRTTAEALVQQTHIHRPVFDDDGRLVDTVVLYANPAAEAALPEHRPHAGKRGSELFDNFDEFFETLYVEAWRHPDRPASIVVDHLTQTDLQLPSTYLEVQARRVGEQIVTVAVDRSVEMRAMRELQESQAQLRQVFLEIAFAEERFRTAVETMNDPLLMLDESGGRLRILYANRAAAAVLGRPWEKVRDIPLADAVDDADLVRVLSDDSPETVAVHLDVDGQLRTFDVSRTVSGTRRVAVLRDVSDRSEQAEMLERIATHDAQTGLPNRLLLDRHLADVTAGSTGSDSVATIVVEIDQMETIQRSLGYRVADRVVAETVRRLTTHAPAGAFVATLAPTSFAVVLNGVAPTTDVTVIARQLARVVARPVDVDGTILHIDSAAGISLAPMHGCEPDALVKRAKTAAWTAARQQTDVRIWQPEADVEATRRIEQLGEIDRALANGEMFLEYQPKIDLGTRQLVGAEALVRWKHPTRGLVAPTEFVDDVEQSALAIPFTSWTLREALGTWMAHADHLPEGSRVAVNLPARLVGHPGLVALVDDALQAAGAPPQRLELEITERGLVASEEIVRENLDALRRLGVDVVIDDFGTGHASLGYLRRLPVAGVKIDRIFMMDLDRDRVNQAVVTACVGVAAALGIAAVAEGVETAGELAAATALGCREGQGYEIARPGPIDALLTRADARATRVDARAAR